MATPVTLVDENGKSASTGGGTAAPGTAGTVGAVGFNIDASATFTRPADTTAYASGDLVANSTTAASVVPMQFTVSRAIDAGFLVRRARLKKSTNVTTNASFRLHLYRNLPTVPANGDNAAWSTTEALYIGSIDVTCDKIYTDPFAKGIGTPNEGSEINGLPSSGTQIIYGLLEARAAYAPGNAEIFTIVLEVLQN